VFGEQFGQVLFIDGHTAFSEGLYPGLVIVYADDMMAHFGKTNRRDKPDITRPDYAN
jgi:hypothetical protein